VRQPLTHLEDADDQRAAGLRNPLRLRHVVVVTVRDQNEIGALERLERGGQAGLFSRNGSITTRFPPGVSKRNVLWPSHVTRTFAWAMGTSG